MNVAYSLVWSITSFILMTICYMVVKTMISPKLYTASYTPADHSNAILLAYGIICLVIQVIVNVSNVNAMCKGSSQPFLPIFLYTLFPFFFIFGSIMIMIKINSGWLEPFSNTIGYFLAMKMWGGAAAFNKIINGRKSDLSESYTTIEGDQSLFTNKLSKNNYVPTLNKLLNKGADRFAIDVDYNKLYKMVIFKDTVSEVIWYLLAGCLAISVTNNIVMNVECEYDPETMKAIKKKADKNFKDSKKPAILQTKHY